MKKILVTSNDFSGSVEMIYGEDGIGAEALPPLLGVTFSNAVLNDRQKAYLMSNAPLRYGSVKYTDQDGNEQIASWVGQWRTEKLTFVESDVELEFERDFWTPFGKKVNKERCLKFWDKMTKADRAVAVFRLGAYLRYLSRYQWRSKADPETYLRKGMWKTDWDNVFE